MKYARSDAAATVWKNKIVVCGGVGADDQILSTVECFDPKRGVWTELTAMPVPLWEHALVTYGNKLVVMGGNENGTV